MTVPPALAGIEPWPLAAEIASAPEATPWALIAAPAERIEAIAAEIAEQLSSLLEAEVVRAHLSSATKLIDFAYRHSANVVVIDGLDGLDAEAWRRIDLGRSRLAREQPAIIVLDETRLALVAANAPNLWSWLGSSIWRGRLEGDAAEQPPS